MPAISSWTSPVPVMVSSSSRFSPTEIETSAASSPTAAIESSESGIQRLRT